MKYRLLVYLAIVFISIAGIAQEQLSLSQAVQLGLENNFDIRIESRRSDLAGTNNNWGAAGLFPNLSASIQGSTSTFDIRETLNPFSILAKTRTNYQLQPQLNLNWNLLSINNIIISKRRFEQLQAESMGNADIVVTNSLQSIILGYYISILERERLNEFSKQLQLSKDKYELIKTRAALGSSVTSDLLLEEGNYLTDSTNYINQELRFRNSLTNLNFLLGRDDQNIQYELTDSLSIDYEPVSYENLLVRMENENIDLKKQYISQSILVSDVSIRKLDRYPTIGLGAFYSFSRNEQDITDWPVERRQIRDSNGDVIGTLSTGNNENMNYGLNFTVSYNLFQGGRINRAIQQAVISEDIGNISLDKMKSSLRRDLKQAYDQYEIRKRLYDISQRRYEAANLNLEISKAKYDNGTINSFDFRTVQNIRLSAGITRLQATYNLIDSEITILRLTGGLLEDYNSN